MKSVLFLCTGNSARSILGESLLNHLGAGRFRAYSAGSRPTGRPNPFALQRLRDAGHDVSGLHSKSWDVFAGPDAPQMDYVITVCASAAGETCPLWPGAPVSAHWGIADPAGAGTTPEEEKGAFDVAFDLMTARVQAFVDLPLEGMALAAQKSALVQIGKMDGAA